MGKRPVTNRLPDGVQGWTDKATGRTYFYTRIAGVKRTRLPGLPWSDEFMTALAEARSCKNTGLKAKRVKPGSFSAAVVAYYNHHGDDDRPGFATLAPSTQSVYRNIAEKFREENADKNISTITKNDVKRWIKNRREQSPNVAYNFLKVLRGIMAAAIELWLRDDDPTEGLKARPKDTDGFHTWTLDEIGQFEARHPIGSKPRLALALLLFTGVRRSDVVQLGRQFEREVEGQECLVFKPQKTRRRKPKKELTLPILPDLRTIVTAFGKPFTPAGFGNWFREQCDMANLPHCSAHGLRKAGATIAALRGATVNQLMAIYGWETAKEAVHYTKAADQVRLAAKAMPLLRRDPEQNLSKPETALSKREVSN